LIQAREIVWRAWFADDVKALDERLPENALAVSSGEKEWKNKAAILRSADDFHLKGGKLLRLEFPRTEIQRFGDVAVVYSQYALETDVAGKRSVETGRVMEVFVLRAGKWINAGWHTDSE
jgi:ketosteroid isomerase-like protein